MKRRRPGTVLPAAAAVLALAVSIAAAGGAGHDERMKVAILLFDGVQIIDYTGPYEVFGQGGIFDVYTVSETGATLTTSMGMSVNPAYSIDNAPEPDILIVPGGGVSGPVGSARTLDWIRKTAKKADYVMSVCNGAFILAKAGLLDGKSATTFYGLIDKLRHDAPRTKVVSDQRWVDNGKVITAAGLSSGIDGSLHMIAKIRGLARAKAVALHMEYDWDPDSDFARAALADLRIPDIDPPDGAKVDLLSTDGDRERWTQRFGIRSDLDPADLAEFLKHEVNGIDRWKAVPSKKAGSDLTGTWTSVDDTGAGWTFTLAVEGGAAPDAPAVATLHVERAR